MPEPESQTLDPALAAEHGALRLPAALDLICADTLHSDLLARLSRDETLVVEGGAVERVSTACVQLLVAARVAAAARGQSFRLAGASDALRQAVDDLGVADALGLRASHMEEA